MGRQELMIWGFPGSYFKLFPKGYILLHLFSLCDTEAQGI